MVVLAGALFWTAHIVLIDKYSDAICPLKFSLTQFVTCGLLSIVIALFAEPISLFAVIEANIPLLYCGIMSVGVAYTCQVIGQRGTEPALASIILCTESVFSAVGGWLILRENMGLRGYFGCGLIFLGIIISQLKIFGGAKKNKAV